jgi:adenosylcobinamide-phosphate synthase
MILEIFILAVAIDLFLGEPPALIHPVVLMGRLIPALRRLARPTRLQGAVLALTVILVSALVGHLFILAGEAIHPLVGIVVSAFLLKSTIAIRSLLMTSKEIGDQIDCDLDEARRMLPALVGRKTQDLSPSQASSAVIESLSENYVDTVVSPIFFFLIFSPFNLGVEAALAFKAISTMDSMLGYKTPELIDLGYAPAKLDDLANWIPARLSIFILAASSPGRFVQALKAARRYHLATPSPNSGWPMAAAAGALGINMEKPGVHLIPCGRDPESKDIGRALRLVATAMAITLIIALLILQQVI